VDRGQRELVRDGFAIFGFRTGHRSGRRLVELRLAADRDRPRCRGAAINYPVGGNASASSAAANPADSNSDADPDADADTDTNADPNTTAASGSCAASLRVESVSESAIAQLPRRRGRGGCERCCHVFVDGDELAVMAHHHQGCGGHGER
jgi:hypothetical protein